MGNTTVTVSVEVEAKTREEALAKAPKKFGGVHSFGSNGGADKLIGVEGENETIDADEPIVFDDVL
jgi:hypothetical protein